MKASTVSRRIFRRALIGARMVEMSILGSNDLLDASGGHWPASFPAAPSVRSASPVRPAPKTRDERNMTPVPRDRQKNRGMRSRCLVFLFTVSAALAFADAPPVAAAEPTRVASVATSGTEPSEASALTAYLAARAWLDADALPAEGEEAARVPLEATTSVCVLLRLDGRLVGAGHDELDAPRSTAAATADDAGLLLRRAVGRAVARALADTTIASVRAELGDKVTARLSLEVELGGPLRPLIGRTIADAARRVAAGNEGVAVLRGERAHRAFPSRLLAADTAARTDRIIAGLLLEAGLPAKDLPEFSAEERVSLARFHSIRLRADSPDAAPAVVTRAGRLVAQRELTEGFVRAAAAQLAARLAAQVVPADPSRANSPQRLLGTLNPTADLYDPPLAAPSDAALASLALARASRSPLLPEPIRGHAAARARALIGWLSALPGEDRSVAADCLAAIASAELGEEGDGGDGGTGADVASAAQRASLRDRIGTAARSLLAGGETGDASDATRVALLAAAAHALGDAVTEGDLEALMLRLEAHASERPARLVDAALPVALLAASPSLAERHRAPLRALFERLTTLASELQIGAAALGAAIEVADPRSADLLGGIEIPGSASGVADTQSLLLMTGIAMTEAAHSPEEWAADPTARATLLPYARFVAQHIATDPWVGGFRNPRTLRGLVRGSLLRDDCPPGATSAALLFLLSAAESGVFRDGAPAPQASPAAVPEAPLDGSAGPK
jgi:hypothetical protein